MYKYARNEEAETFFFFQSAICKTLQYRESQGAIKGQSNGSILALFPLRIYRNLFCYHYYDTVSLSSCPEELQGVQAFVTAQQYS